MEKAVSLIEVSMNKPWLDNYPNGVPAQVDVGVYRSLASMLSECFRAHAEKVGFRFMGESFTYAQINEMSDAFAGYLQRQGLRKGDRVAVMLPNTPQYVVAVAGIFKAGMVLVNVNPLYTARELEHQLKDSDTKLIVIIENFAHTYAQVASASKTQKVVLTSIGELLSPLKGVLVNFALRYIKKAVPKFNLPQAVPMSTALSVGRQGPVKSVSVGPEDIAVLQYTGGTTGVSKGATLLHRNLVANILQCEAWYKPVLSRMDKDEQVGIVCALPLYHVYAFTGIMMLSIRLGGRLILIPNPRDIRGLITTLAKEIFHCLPAVNTLFNAIARDSQFHRVNWRNLKISVSGGMATQKATADIWLEKTGCVICDAYGLSEASPLVICNPILTSTFTGGIGMPVPNTEVTLLNEDGNQVQPGYAGEIAIRGPQVMAGYWKRDDETDKVMTSDGFLLTGDIGVMDETGYFRIVDRKKDMILVSGFNVYPNEIEDVVAGLEGVRECAVIGIPDDKSGEAVKVFVVKNIACEISEIDVTRWCERHLTPYKRPKIVEFIDDLPKSPVGKILRRELRK